MRIAIAALMSALVLTAATPAALLDAMGHWRPREDQAWASAEV